MRRTIAKYSDVYRHFLATCFAEATSYRLHFFLLIFMDIVFYCTTLGSVDFIFNHVDMIGPWGRNEFLFFVTFMLAIDQLHMTLVSEGFWQFSFEIRTGALDFILLKPIGTMFPIFFRHIRPASMLLAPVAWGLLIYFGRKIELSLFAWVALPFFLLSSFALIVAIEVLVAMSMFWIIESFGINFLRMQLQNIARWPDFIFRYGARKFFTIFLPVLLAGNIPVKIMFGDIHPLNFGFVVLALIVIGLVTKFFWHRGLRSYESASS